MQILLELRSTKNLKQVSMVMQHRQVD